MKYAVKKSTNCPNCNASLQSSVCQYCGTRVGWDEGEVDFHPEPITIPITVSGKMIEEVFADFGMAAYSLGGDPDGEHKG